jgi:hypothetical protein
MSSQKVQTSKKSSSSSKGSQKKKKTAKRKPVQFQLTWSGMISWAVFSFVVVAWSFILGVLVGRGYQPETFVPLVAEYMPGHAAEEHNGDQNQGNVLSAQELGFYDSLQKSGQDNAQPSGATKSSQSAPPDPEVVVERNEQRYTYEYQVGAFKRQSQAATLRSSLAERGFSVDVVQSMVQGTPWYRVLVRHTGQAGEVEPFIARLRKAGVTNFFLRSKNPE